MGRATTVRLPDDVGERLDAHCAATGAVKNRVVALALRSWLEGPLPEREQAILDRLRSELGAREVEAA